MRKNRPIRTRGKRNKKEALDLDITSLLDILVIMLVFLLNSYSTAGFIVDLPRGLTLPLSESTDVSTSGINIQISPTTIWVDDEEILNVRDLDEGSAQNLDHQGRRIIPLFNRLVEKRERIEQISRSAPNAQNFSGMANLIVDETIRYSLIQKIMYTTAEAGFQRFKFVVMGDETHLMD